MANLGDKMTEALTKKTRSRIKRIGQMAQQMDYAAYIAGGCVRDLMLGRQIIDVDIGVVGDAVALAEEAEKRFRCKVKKSLRYRNAALLFADGEKIDLTTARNEKYPEPGAWPVTEASDIRDDLARRDFSINAMAIYIEPNRFGKLVDPHHGAKDIKARIIRALYKYSFIDDPTRILRACRFAGRFGFQIEATTAQWMQSYRNARFNHSQAYHRIAIEMNNIFLEADPRPALAMVSDLQIRVAINHHFLNGKHVFELLDRIPSIIEWFCENQPDSKIDIWKIRILTIFSTMHTMAMVHFLKRLNISDLKLVHELKAMRETHRRLNNYNVHNDSGFAKAFAPLSIEALLVILAKTPSTFIRDALQRYLVDVRHRKLHIRGADLMKLGLPPGPEIGRILAIVQDAVYDGEVKGRASQLEMVKKLVAGVEK